MRLKGTKGTTKPRLCRITGRPICHSFGTERRASSHPIPFSGWTGKAVKGTGYQRRVAIRPGHRSFSPCDLHRRIVEGTTPPRKAKRETRPQPFDILHATLTDWRTLNDGRTCNRPLRCIVEPQEPLAGLQSQWPSSVGRLRTNESARRIICSAATGKPASPASATKSISRSARVSGPTRGLTNRSIWLTCVMLTSEIYAFGRSESSASLFPQRQPPTPDMQSVSKHSPE